MKRVTTTIIILLATICQLSAQNLIGLVTEENAFWLNHTQTKYDKMNIRLKKTRYK